MSSHKHPNYKILNLIGYGLAKFGGDFVAGLGFSTKSKLYDYCVQIGIADTRSTVKNRQDLFDPFFDNNRKGWWQKKNAYIHRKIHIDSLLGHLDMRAYVAFLRMCLAERSPESGITPDISPVARSSYKKLQQTGLEAELFFMHNYQSVALFKDGVLSDARILGDGYDFQIQIGGCFYLSEVKGVVESAGPVRFTEKEHEKAREYRSLYVLSVVSNLCDIPKITAIQDPVNRLRWERKVLTQERVSYHSAPTIWEQL